MFGFIIGIWAKGFEQLNVVPALIVTPLTFLGGSFYPLSYLPQPWYTVSLFNPVAYLISGFRWAFFGNVGDIDVRWSLGFIGAFLALCMLVVWLIFKTGYRLKS
jgi:ABC-2 type transport system permease protein